MMKLTTTTTNGDKVLAHTVAKNFSMSIEDLVTYGKAININIKSAQHILSLNEANNLVCHIQNEQAKLYFNSKDWCRDSSIDDYQNLVAFIDQTLQVIDAQIERHKDILSHSNKAFKALQVLDMDNQDLIKIKIYLLSKFDFSLENLKDKLIFMKSEALEYLDAADSSPSILQDKKLAKKEIDFNFTATKIVRLYEAQIKKIHHFSKVDCFFSTLLDAVKALQKADETFKTRDKQKLNDVLCDGYLEAYHDALYDEWTKEINKLNQLHLRFICAYFIEKISEHTVLAIFDIIQGIKDDLEDFYLTIRSGLITKYQDNPKSKLLQEIASKERIFKIYQKSQPRFIDLLQQESSQVACRFINALLGELLDFNIEEKSDGYEAIYEKMVQLHGANLEIYLDDIVTYGKELEKRDLEISKLMFKMQKDLEQGA